MDALVSLQELERVFLRLFQGRDGSAKDGAVSVDQKARGLCHLGLTEILLWL
jgi:hypothetical protein